MSEIQRSTADVALNGKRKHRRNQERNAPVLEVTNLVVEFPTPNGVFRAVDDVSFSVWGGSTTGIVGESGSGKSTIARAITRLLTPTSGQIILDGVDISHLDERRLRPLRSKVQMIFQDPYGSLDPHLTASAIVSEPLRRRGMGRGEAQKVARELLDLVGLPTTAAERRPVEFSGGQRQRIGIARALASRPDVLVCDEATSALDVSVQAQVLQLLRQIQDETGVTYLFISHNLGVVRELCDNLVVMRSGRVVEQGFAPRVLSAPAHEYTRSLRRAALDPLAISGLKPRHLLRAASEPPTPTAADTSEPTSEGRR